eukprot:TRINITY_DN50154_c0_g1_i1.p1 TRINITY_DN50154_c0_g1~~TRINITY_DN50154_c0_g1_i1.p1  ORF type:complete len:704 (-),score=144.28 TRINITY_DN50154_c0_g1_i1:20-2131(-)
MQTWFEVKTDKGWDKYDADTNSQIVNAWQKGDPFVEFSRFKFQYRVTFKGDGAAEQLNLNTKTVREVRAARAEDDASGTEATSGLTCCDTKRWQVRLAGEWVNLEDGAQLQLNTALKDKRASVQLTIARVSYTVDLNEMVQINVQTGRKRDIRYTDNNATADSLPLKSRAGQQAQTGVRYQLFLEGGWRTLPPWQAQTIQKNLANGKMIFEVNNGPHLQYRVNMNDYTQTNLLTGKVRSLRQLHDPSALEAATVDGIVKSFESLAAGSSVVELEGVVKVWQDDAVKRAPDAMQAGQLVRASTESLFEMMCLTKENCATKDEWVHYWLLVATAPSKYAMQIVQDGIRENKAEHIGQLTSLFLEASPEAKTTGEISKKQMIEACRAYETKYCGLRSRLFGASFQGAKQWLAEHDTTSEKDTDGEKDDEKDDERHFNYFEFVSVFIGRESHEVWIYQYDISDGKIQWLAPILMGRRMEGVWHTGVVVYGKEYWFGGEIFESDPEDTPFGTPLKKVLIGRTVCTKDELWDKISRELCREYTPENYDVLTHNCNNFSDECTLFLSNLHIPDEVRTQPETCMNAWAVKALRPVLNKCLGGFGESMDGLSAARKAGEEAADGDWKSIKVGSLVTYSREGMHPVTAEVLWKEDMCCDIWWWEPLGHTVGLFSEAAMVSKMQVANLGQSTERATARRIRSSTVDPEGRCCIS